MQEEKQSVFITYTRAKEEYYLTDKMFRSIGEPDELAKNPHYRTAAPMKLYFRERVEEWVDNNIELVEKSKIRRLKLSKIQKARHEKLRQQMIKIAEEWQPKFTEEIPVDICEQATNFYKWRYEDFRELTLRGLVSYIRHTHTNYEQFLVEVSIRRKTDKGKTGIGLLYPILRVKVDDIIIEKFNSDELIDLPPESGSLPISVNS